VPSKKKKFVEVSYRGTPIITDKQIERISSLVDRLEKLWEEMGETISSLEVLTGSNNPEGWETPTRVKEV
jgi:hypothetical protein